MQYLAWQRSLAHVTGFPTARSSISTGPPVFPANGKARRDDGPEEPVCLACGSDRHSYCEPKPDAI